MKWTQRELKFRAWRKKDGWWIKPKWFTIDGGGSFIEYCETNVDGIGDEVFVTQWTGLVDKNGKGIYEGDIIKENPNGHIGVVKNEHGNFYVEWDDPQYPDWDWMEMACDHMGRIEVIGNVFESPELLKGSDKKNGPPWSSTTTG